MFKGVSPAQVSRAAKERVVKLKAVKAGEIEKPPGPKMGVEPINPDGTIGVKFN